MDWRNQSKFSKEQLKVSANQRLLLFQTLKIGYTILQCSLLTVLRLGSYYHARIVLSHSATSLPMSFFMLKFSMTLVSSFVCSNSFIAFLIFEFLIFFDFECLKRPQIVFYVSSEAKEGTHFQLWMVIQIRTSKR